MFGTFYDFIYIYSNINNTSIIYWLTEWDDEGNINNFWLNFFSVRFERTHNLWVSQWVGELACVCAGGSKCVRAREYVQFNQEKQLKLIWIRRCLLVSIKFFSEFFSEFFYYLFALSRIYFHGFSVGWYFDFGNRYFVVYLWYQPSSVLF